MGSVRSNYRKLTKVATVMLTKVAVVAAVGLVALPTEIALADTLTGCLTSGGRIVKVAVGNEPVKPCGAHQTKVSWDQNGGSQPMIVVDSQTPPKPVGPALRAGGATAEIAFSFEGEIYWLSASPSTLGPTGSILFPNDTCSPPGFAETSSLPKLWSSLKTTMAIPTAAGRELWVQDGEVSAGFLALSRTDEDPPFGCTTSAGKGIPRQTGPVVPMRNSVIILDIDFPPPYNLVNLPRLP
jgi:hypothetical protein